MNNVIELYSIFDRTRAVYGMPYPEHTLELAKRKFIASVNNPKMPSYMKPTDYVLYCLGVYNMATGVFTKFESPKMIMSGYVDNSEHKETIEDNIRK